MKETRILMGMPITVEIPGDGSVQAAIDRVFDYFKYVDEKFSTYKDTSEITAINRGKLTADNYSEDMREVLRLCEQTKKETDDYFNIVTPAGSLDPSGLVKGWSIYRAADLLRGMGVKEFYIDAGGDIEAAGKIWKVGIKNPFKQEEIVKVLYVQDAGVATSGTYIRGEHIYNPKDSNRPANDIMSLTVIGPNIYEADRFATAAFAMGKPGIMFIENLKGFEAYMIDRNGIATMTSGFGPYTKEPEL